MPVGTKMEREQDIMSAELGNQEAQSKLGPAPRPLKNGLTTAAKASVSRRGRGPVNTSQQSGHLPRALTYQVLAPSVALFCPTVAQSFLSDPSSRLRKSGTPLKLCVDYLLGICIFLGERVHSSHLCLKDPAPKD